MNTKIEKNKISSFDILKRVIPHLSSERKTDIKIVIILSFLVSFAESISIAMLIPFISFFINPENYLFNNFLSSFLGYLNIEGRKEILSFVSITFILIVVLGGFIKLKYIKFSNHLTDNITSDFQIKIFQFLINQDYSYHFKYGTNEIMSNLAQKTGSFTSVIFSAINIFNSSLIMFGIICILIFNEPFYTPIIIFSILAFFYLIFKIRSSTVLKKGQIINLNKNFMIDIFQNSVGYFPEIIIYNLKKFFLRTLSKASINTAKSSAEIRSISMTPRIYLEMFVIILVIMLINFSGLTERNLETNISYLAILAFGAQKCLPLINNIYLLSINFKGSIPTINDFLNILDRENNIEDDKKTFNSLPFNDSIKIDKISFNYEENQAFILKNFDFEIKKGEKIVIKGETGSGKSTLVNIISGLFKPTKGKILVDGISINSENLKNWQKNISIVPQIVFLNDSTILENIAIAETEDEINLEKVKNSAKIAHIDEFINSLPNNYHQRVGERGVRLSGGQRQRIGIARALYRGSNLIILDEPTNALDYETETLVMDSITNLSKEITLIMISHSNSSLKYFDKIIDLDKLK